jgi:hypothetical protein
MRLPLLLMALVTAASAHAARGGSSVAIRIETLREAPHAGSRVYTLERSGGQLTCRTPGIPEHVILMPRLKSLEPPFASDKRVEAPRCPKRVTWGKATRCYKPGFDSLIDEIVRRCLSV